MQCSKILSRTYFKSYSEFYLSLCIARELGRRGMVLDMSDMTIDPDMVTLQYKHYFRWLIQEGYVVLNTSKKVEPIEVPMVMTPTENFEDLLEKGILFSTGRNWQGNNITSETKYWWSYTVTCPVWGKEHPNLIKTLQLNSTLMHLIAFWLVRWLLDGERERFSILIEQSIVGSTFIYSSLYSLQLTLPIVGEICDLNVDFSMYEVDIEYSIFCDNGMVMGRYKYWSVSEKKQWLEKFGMKPGAIVVLYKRKGICTNNKIGKIESAITARIDEIGKDFVAVTTLAVNKTREEMIDEYYEIDEESRYLFVDLLTRRPYQHSEILNLYDIGVENYMYQENSFLALIDTSTNAVTNKKITIGGESEYVEMSEVDAIYWVLRQFDIDFDKDLYKKMYNHGEDLLWDDYGEVVVD